MVIEAPPNLVHWHRAESVVFARDGSTYVKLDCGHTRKVVLAPEMERDPARLLRTGSRWPCRDCARAAGEEPPRSAA
jgi:hypothetical protein